MDQMGMNERGIQDSTAFGTANNNASSNPHNGYAKSAFVCGIIAVSLNLLVLTAVIGFILSIISIAFGANTYRQSVYGKAGFVLGLLSIFIILAYVLSAVIIKVADPFM